MGAPKVSRAMFTTSMARTTPAQKPRGLRRRTLLAEDNGGLVTFTSITRRFQRDRGSGPEPSGNPAGHIAPKYIGTGAPQQVHLPDMTASDNEFVSRLFACPLCGCSSTSVPRGVVRSQSIWLRSACAPPLR